MSAFTEASLQEVSSGCEFFPAYSIILTALKTWHSTQETIRLASPMTARFRVFLDEREDNLAHKQRLAERMADAKADWADVNKIRASLRNIDDHHPYRLRLGRMLAALVGRHAPQNLGHLPPEFLG